MCPSSQGTRTPRITSWNQVTLSGNFMSAARDRSWKLIMVLGTSPDCLASSAGTMLRSRSLAFVSESPLKRRTKASSSTSMFCAFACSCFVSSFSSASSDVSLAFWRTHMKLNVEVSRLRIHPPLLYFIVITRVVPFPSSAFGSWKRTREPGPAPCGQVTITRWLLAISMKAWPGWIPGGTTTSNMVKPEEDVEPVFPPPVFTTVWRCGVCDGVVRCRGIVIRTCVPGRTPGGQVTMT
mmetsp:Transcript_14845/g.56212  ORF Transcript_14845/g.56212 Transcript_14845/m.56212 type:complete len:238 (+) Transcript_14845:1189-1902(+)